MVKKHRASGRNSDGSYDLSAAGQQQPESASKSKKRYVARHSASAKRKMRADQQRIDQELAGREPAAAASSAAYEEPVAAAAAYPDAQGDAFEPADACIEPIEPIEPDYTPRTRTSAFEKSRYTARKQGGGKKVAIVIALVLAAVLVGCGIAAAVWYGNISSNFGEKEGGPEAVAPAENEPYYVLLMGSDSRDGLEGYGGDPDMEGNRTDSIMVARVDEINQQVSLLSIPRDLRVNIPGTGYAKINSAYEYGGLQTLIDVINNMLGIKINYYAFIYFDGFENLVDKLGGVTVEVPEGTYYNGITVPSGEAVLINGQEALTLARCRHGNPPDQGPYAMGEYQRAMNQRNLIKAIGKKVLQSDATSLPSLIEGLASCLETNMDLTKIVSIAEHMRGMDTDSIDAAQIPIAGSSIYSELEGYSEWYAIAYEDVFDVVKRNFVSGTPMMQGLEAVDTDYYGDDIGTSYIDGERYAYTSYDQHVIAVTGSSPGIEALKPLDVSGFSGSFGASASTGYSDGSYYEESYSDEYY